MISLEDLNKKFNNDKINLQLIENVLDSIERKLLNQRILPSYFDYNLDGYDKIIVEEICKQVQRNGYKTHILEYYKDYGNHIDIRIFLKQ